MAKYCTPFIYTFYRKYQKVTLIIQLTCNGKYSKIGLPSQFVNILPQVWYVHAA